MRFTVDKDNLLDYEKAKDREKIKLSIGCLGCAGIVGLGIAFVYLGLLFANLSNGG